MAAGLCERIAAVTRFCRLFGLGLLFNDSTVSRTADAILLLANLSFSVYGWDYVTDYVQQRMPAIWDPSTVMSVVKVYTYLLTPPITLVVWQFQKRALTRTVQRLDDIAPSAVRTATLAPFCRYCVAWTASSVAAEIFMYFMFQHSTDFQFFSPFECVMIAVYNVWFNVPLLLYALLIDTIRRSVRQINGRITSIDAWKRYRARWKELTRSAARLARVEFGVIIVAFVVYEIAAAVFFLFCLYFVAYRVYGLNPVPTAVYLINILLNASRLFEIVRITRDCRLEMLKTKKILNSVDIKTIADFKELKYVSLYMLHADFSFRPCDIFDMSYSNLIKIATLISAFVTFEIQMKLR